MLRNCVGWAVAFVVVLTSAISAAPDGAPPSIVPHPVQIEARPGVFCVTSETSILFDPGSAEVQATGEYLAGLLREETGFDVAVTANNVTTTPDRAILLTTRDALPSWGDEGYQLQIDPQQIVVRAPNSRGLFYGIQTLRQLGGWGLDRRSVDHKSLSIPCVRVQDKPRYRWRGMLLDCCRHFMTKEFVKRYIDLLAYHKMNVLHWHLTEDQGWRIEIKKYPKLTEVGAWRGSGDDVTGGFYTQDDVREIVAYAASRHITVVPEIEMPGHSLAALAAYPELSCTGGPFSVGTRWGVYPDVYCAGNDQTFEFLQDVLSEVIELFPSPFVHIGGDECPKDRWKTCAKCQSRISEEGLADEHELQSYFVRRIERFLGGKGRRLIGWDEILEGGLAPNATVQSWRGMDGAIAAARAGHDVISSPTSHCYLDYAQWRSPTEPLQMGYIDLEKVYSFEPTPAQLSPDQAAHVLGAEGNLWSEHAPQARVDHQVFPRLCALAEVTWSPPNVRDWSDFRGRMKTHYRRLDALGVTYFVEPPRCDSSDTVFQDSLEIVFSQPFDHGSIHFTLDGSDPSPRSRRYTKPLRITESTQVKARTVLAGGRLSETVDFAFVKQAPREPVPVRSVAPGLTYSYYEGDWDRLPDFGTLTPVASGHHGEPDMAVRRRDERFAIRFAGYLEVPTEGVYSFYLTSDDGSKLWIGDEVIVDHDGLHAVGEQRGQIILKAGRHPITVGVFQAGGGRNLSVSYEGPRIERQRIPATALMHASPTP